MLYIHHHEGAESTGFRRNSMRAVVLLLFVVVAEAWACVLSL
jgi:hypothetical protein